MSSGCEKIEDCPVLQMLKNDVDNKIGTITGQYEQVHSALEQNTKNMQAVTVAMATQTEAVKGLVVSVQEYKSENESDHNKLEDKDDKLHSRVTEVATKQAEQKGANSNNVNWKELIKIAGVFAIVSAFFKYLLPIMGG